MISVTIGTPSVWAGSPSFSPLGLPLFLWCSLPSEISISCTHSLSRNGAAEKAVLEKPNYQVDQIKSFHWLYPACRPYVRHLFQSMLKIGTHQQIQLPKHKVTEMWGESRDNCKAATIVRLRQLLGGRKKRTITDCWFYLANARHLQFQTRFWGRQFRTIQRAFVWE